MPKPVCIPCQRFFRPFINGVNVLENMPKDGAMRPPQGIEAPEQWQPYKVWKADAWRCNGCGATIVIGFGQRPMWERYFESPLPVGAKLYPVNDC